jgi:hypothetical protein
MTTTFTAAGECRRNTLQTLPVIDGLFHGRNYANRDNVLYV